MNSLKSQVRVTSGNRILETCDLRLALKNMKNKTLKLGFLVTVIGLMAWQSVSAASPEATSAVIKNSTESSVDIEIIGTDFHHFKYSQEKEASADDRNLIIFNGTNPLSATIDNSSAFTATFPIEAGTGRNGDALSIVAGTIEDSDGNPSVLMNIGNQELSDNAEPFIFERKTLDSDNNGKIDGILFVASEKLNDDFDGLSVAVEGYDVSEINTGDFPDDHEFVALLDENEEECSGEDQAGCDTDSAPGILITSNSTLADMADVPMNVESDNEEVSASDGVSPIVVGVEFKKANYRGKSYNAVSIAYSEPVQFASGEDDQESSTDLGAMTTARVLSGIGSWNGSSNMVGSLEGGNQLSLNGSGKLLTVYLNTDPESHFKSGLEAPATPTFTPEASEELTDMAGNSVNESITVTAENPSPWDIKAPTIADVYSCDPDGDGDISRMQVDFSEPILDASIEVSQFEADNDETPNNGEIPLTFNTATAGCDGDRDDTGANDEKIRFEFKDGIKGTDAAFLHVFENGVRDLAGNLLKKGNALGHVHDKAAPVIVDFRYEDSTGLGGRIDRFLVSFSEAVMAEKSHLSANDLMLTNVGDFEGADFGSDNTNAFLSDGQNVYVELGSEANVIDTYEDSEAIEITTQNNFVLEDEAGNVNDTLDIQSQVTFSDGAAPVIKSFGYQDSGGNGFIDTFKIVFSELVTEASFLSANDLQFTDPGSFEGALFGNDETDLITEDTYWATVFLGTEATSGMLSEDSGLIAVATQNSFAISDGLNVNSRREDQMQATFMSSDLLDIPSGSDMDFMEDMMEESAPETRFIQNITSNFNDIAGHWAENYIKDIAAMGIVNGKSEGKFAPNDLMTRAELTKVAVNAFNITYVDPVPEQPFIDVRTDVWYAPYIKAAKDKGIVQGDGDRFNPNDPITRAEVLKILIEGAGFSEVHENFQANYSSKPGWTYVFFPDVPMAEWYARYVAYARDFEIAGGYDDGNFRPGNSITRAEVAKIVMNVLDLLDQ